MFMKRETHDIYYNTDKNEFNRQYEQFFKENPTAKEVDVKHVLVDPKEGKVRATITFEVES